MVRGENGVSENHLDPETIAAYMDGRLSPERRAAVAAQIAQSPEAFEILADAAVIRAAAGEDDADLAGAPKDTSARPSRSPWLRRTLMLGLPLAAGLAAILLVPQLRHDDWRTAAFPGGSLLNVQGPGSTDGALGTGWHDPPWTTTRGGSVAGVDYRLAFRVAVRIVQLRVSLEASDPVAIEQSTATLQSVLEATSVGGPASAEIARIARSVSSGEASFADVRGDWADASRAVRDSNPVPWFDLGLWAEQARLAILAADASFFEPGGPAAERLRDLVRQLEQVDTAGARDVLPIIVQLQDSIASGGVSRNVSSARQPVELLFRVAG
jgi:hypothetical protein